MHLGGGALGHLDVSVSAAAYTLVSNTDFDIPANQGCSPKIDATSTQYITVEGCHQYDGGFNTFKVK
jgi:hypothetical protein